MDKQEKTYRIEKAFNNLRCYTTIDDISRLENILEQVLKVLESIVEEN